MTIRWYGVGIWRVWMILKFSVCALMLDASGYRIALTSTHTHATLYVNLPVTYVVTNIFVDEEILFQTKIYKPDMLHMFT